MKMMTKKMLHHQLIEVWVIGTKRMDWINEKPWNGLSIDINPNISPREMAYKVKLDLEKSWNPTGGGSTG